jgi:transposase-like protein
MREIACLCGGSDGIEVEFVEREAIPVFAMWLGIRTQLSGLSLSNTVQVLAFLGLDRCQTTVYNWVHKAELETARGCAIG